MPVDLDRRFDVAAEVARSAGARALGYFARRAELAVEHKGVQDHVSVADREVERHILETLRAAFPDDAILAEESGGQTGDAVWAIDPIDGTTNFLRGVPCWCVSIAFVVEGAVELGVIYEPVHDRLFRARRGRGAEADGRALSVSACTSLDRALVGFGHSQRSSDEVLEASIHQLLAADAELRRLGSAAMMLAYVAQGTLDAFFEAHLSPWDALAGLLLVSEAGGHSNDFLAGDALRRGNAVLACAPGLRDALVAITGIR